MLTFSVSSVVGGTDQLSGVLVSVLRNEGAAHRVIYTHQLPWFMLIYYHTVTLTCNDLTDSRKQVNEQSSQNSATLK